MNSLPELPGLTVRLDRLVYENIAHSSPLRPHCFVYFITIRNDSSETVKIIMRKWVVTPEIGDVIVVEGEGVVGETPLLQPGEEFSYNSYHLLERTPATAQGSYLGLTTSGNKVITRIPPFTMTLPAD